jgi:hypothetical protein
MGCGKPTRQGAGSAQTGKLSERRGARHREPWCQVIGGFGGGPTGLWGWVRLFVLCCIEDTREWLAGREKQ